MSTSVQTNNPLSQLAVRAHDLLDNMSYEQSPKDFAAWVREVAEVLGNLYPNQGIDINWLSLKGCDIGTSSAKHPTQQWTDYRNMIRERLSWLAGCQIEQAEHSREAPILGIPKRTSKVFLVHGRDEVAKLKVKSFLHDIAIEAIILHEMPNKGNSILDKLEENAEVGYAVVLATGDDLARHKAEKKLVPRARQNVIFELGFFVGRWSRRNVCVLIEDRVEKPSDYDGIVWIPFDESEKWKNQLARELIAAGLPVKVEGLAR